jgi:hypothetical protein
VSPTAVERETLDAAVDRLSDRTEELGIAGLGRSADCSGLDVGLVVATPQVEAKVVAAVGSGIPLHFSETGLASPA